MKKYNYYICKIFLFAFLDFSGYAQNPIIKHYSVNQGLPSSECYWTIQDSKGYLWVATDAGVVKYDGYKFTTYNSAKGLPDNTVFKIHEDHHGRIWFAGFSGRMAYYSYDTDSIYGIEANDKLDVITHHFPVDFTFDEKDNLYVSIFNKGYIRANYPRYKVDEHYYPADTNYYIKKVGKNGIIYGSIMPEAILTINGFEKKNPRPISFPLITENTKHLKQAPLLIFALTFHFHVIQYNDSTVLFSSENELVSVTDHSQKFLYRRLFDPTYSNRIFSMYKDHQNYLWVNKKGSGSCVYVGLNLAQPLYHFLDGLSVTSVTEDRDHGYWLTTLEDGLFYIPSIKFHYINQIQNGSANKIFSIALLKNNLHFLSSDFTLASFDIKTQKIKGNEKLILAGSYIAVADTSLIVCQGWSFIMHGNKKVFFYEMINGKYFNVRLKRGQNYNDKFFLGFTNGDIFLVNKNTGEVTDDQHIVRDLPRIFSVHLKNNEMWIGTKNGLYNWKNNKIHFLGKEHPLFASRIEDIASNGDTLFFATRGYGLISVYHNKIIKQYTEADGLASNMTRCVTIGKNGNIWVGTNRGISRLKKTGKNYVLSTLSVLTGLVSNEVNQIVEHEKSLYIATNGGLEVIDVEDFYGSGKKIDIYIEEFRINGDVFSPQNIYALEHNQNYVSISYKGISVRSEGQLKYKYRLEGLDNKWTYTKNIYVQYTTLPPGNYKFVVYVIDEDGKTSSDPATVSFIIGQPYWKTWWFILTVIGSVFVLAYYFYRQRINSIRQKEKEKTEYNKKITESELKALRAQMNPHFMFNAINSIQNFVLKNDSRSAQKYLTKFARLIRSVLENSKHELVWLSKEVEALELYIELEALRASFSFDYEVIIDDSLNATDLFIPPMIIQPYIENAILHGIVPLTERRGKLMVKFSLEGSALKCIVDDNGIGRILANEIKLRKQQSHQSMGMNVTQDRITILNQQTHNMLASVVVLDKVVEGIAMGTTVEISINIKKSQND